MLQFFVDRCVQNLHVVLCMSPTGQQLQIRCRNFPGLVNNTTIDWFQPWPEQALYAVASVFLAEVSPTARLDSERHQRQRRVLGNLCLHLAADVYAVFATFCIAFLPVGSVC